jgi:hypothetical protein
MHAARFGLRIQVRGGRSGNVPGGESSSNRPWDWVVGVAMDDGDSDGDGGRMWSAGLGTWCGVVVEEMCWRECERGGTCSN